MKRKTISVGIFLTLVITAFAIVPLNVSAATTWYVDDAACPGPGSGTLADPFCKIQDAIDAAGNGDIIIVAAGTYYENVVVNKELTLQAGSAPIIDGGGSGDVVTISADNVIVNGFEITGGTMGIVAGARSGLKISNNIIHHNVNPGYPPDAGSQQGCGITIWAAAGPCNNNLIENNVVYSNERQGIFIGTNEAESNSVGNTIRGNKVYDNGMDGYDSFGIQLNYASGNTIENNEIYGHTYTSESWLASGIYFYNANDNDISGNNIHDNNNGICQWITDAAVQALDANKAHCNNIFDNIDNGINSFTAEAPIDATNNWWGDASGPTHASNPGGSGDTVSDNVDYNPWGVQPDPCEPCLWSYYNEAQYLDSDIATETTIVDGNNPGNPNGNENSPPLIKCMWMYDEDVEILIENCDNFPCICHTEGENDYWLHDACPFSDGLQVKPILGGSVKVGYYAVLTDPEGVGCISAVYADVWHPDGKFKYQLTMEPIGFDENGNYDKTEAMELWDHVENCHYDLLKINWDAWTPSNDWTYEYDIHHELNQSLAYIYYVESEISYCQPAGEYCVGIRGHDNYGAWCDYLPYTFWYIPTAAVDIDFDKVDYGSVSIDPQGFYPAKWVPGDTNFNIGDGLPTVRNIGNTPVTLSVWQDDMEFGTTNDQDGDPYWNVYYDARLGAPNPEDDNYVEYYPEEEAEIPDVLDICTQEKLDFSIHVSKGFPDPGDPYIGHMRLFAQISYDTDNLPWWDTPDDKVGDRPHGVPENGPCTDR